jgi:hypothetical protein
MLWVSEVDDLVLQREKPLALLVELAAQVMDALGILVVQVEQVYEARL